MSRQYYIWKDKKEKIIEDSSFFQCGHRPPPEEVVEMIQTSLQKDA
jgi:hypothetical protein